jgi:predicted transcriptional regulator
MINRRTNTTIEEVNFSIQELLHQWNISSKDNDNIFDKIVGLQIRKIRLMRGKSQIRLSKAVGVTFQQIQKYEKGLNACSHKNLKKISEYLDIDIDFFTKPLDDMNLTFLKKRENNVYPFKTEPYLAR